MKYTVFLIGLFSLTLAACVSAPAPVRTGGNADNTPRTSGAPPQGAFVPDATFSICNIGRVQNAPISRRDGRVSDYAQLFVVDRMIALATVPVNGGCLSSGYGLRGGRAHKGLDISAKRGAWVYSAAPGIVREAGWGGEFGNYILIEHGYNVFTRYAHLEAIVDGLEVGSELGFGWPIGQVGNSSTRNIGVHLHYEVLTGNYRTPKKSFGLTANDPFGFPPYRPAPQS